VESVSRRLRGALAFARRPGSGARRARCAADFHPVGGAEPGAGHGGLSLQCPAFVRAHGIAGTTLRRHLAALVEAGLIIRRDSPNGKRYARKDRAGEIETAFGFDLSPLHARADELAMLAQQVADDRARFRRVKEELSICRRDVRKLISAAMEEGADGDWAAIEDIYLSASAAAFPAARRSSRSSTSSTKWSCCARKSSTVWKRRKISKKQTPMTTKSDVTYRIQNPIPSMNLNLAPKKSRARSRRKMSDRSGSRSRSRISPWHGAAGLP
jgi:replication initiation protein RepC